MLDMARAQDEGVWPRQRSRPKVVAHRAVYEEVRGPVADGMKLDHKCAQPACVNPDRMEQVTHHENCRRGRATKLTWPKVRAIRASTDNGPALAARYGVATQTIYRIRVGQLWPEGT
jgi:hypothetical protein